MSLPSPHVAYWELSFEENFLQNVAGKTEMFRKIRLYLNVVDCFARCTYINRQHLLIIDLTKFSKLNNLRLLFFIQPYFCTILTIVFYGA